jgi:2-polyprenyl-3-methyl-5-hydroxy-6-metoxy-1,4-benzoquinol methylase
VPATVQHCPLCHSEHSAAFDQRLFHDQPVYNRLCLECGLVFQSPRMTEEELAAFYQQEYRTLYQGDQGPNPKDLAVQAGRAAELVRFFQSAAEASRPTTNEQLSYRSDVATAVHSHLDIGCSAGLLMQGLQKAYNCRTTGIEPGTAYREYAQAQGLAVYATLDELAARFDLEAVKPSTVPVGYNQGRTSTADIHRFDLISMAHVLEHLPDPLVYLANLRRQWLAPGGWLLIETPNLYGHDCFEIAHLVSYSPHTLKQMLAQAGFRVLSISVHGRPRSNILPLYITLLAQPDEMSLTSGETNSHEVAKESNVRWKRRTAMLRRTLLTRIFPQKAWLPIPSQPG